MCLEPYTGPTEAELMAADRKRREEREHLKLAKTKAKVPTCGYLA